MATIVGDGYICSCSERDECNEYCPIYRIRHDTINQMSMIQVSEAEYEKMNKAMLIARYLADLSRMVEEIKEEM